MSAGRKVFCISMQRSGTTSVGDWLESHGLRRAGFPSSSKLGWSRRWFEGAFERIFSSTEFQETDVFEDDPWWCPEFYRYVAHRFPEALFVLLVREPAAWFRSLCAHSAGRNPGATDLHCKIYRREDELEKLREADPRIDPGTRRLLDITRHEAHYVAAYERHNREVQAFFSSRPGRLFCRSLTDPLLWGDLCHFVGVAPRATVPIPRSNAATPAMKQALAEYLAKSGQVE